MDLVTTDMLVVLCAFYGLLGASLLSTHKRAYILDRNLKAWFIDIVSLLMQGVVVPLVSTLVLVSSLQTIWPNAAGSLALHPILGFCLSFIAVDYLYYWNHRLLHHPWFFSIHAMHHVTPKMEILLTSRNSLLTPFFIVYVWCNALAIHVLTEPYYYLLGAALTSALDIWRHSEFWPESNRAWQKHFQSLLMSPRHHSWHHTRKGMRCNYGANLSIWDRFHGTYLDSRRTPRRPSQKYTLSLKDFFIFTKQNDLKGKRDGGHVTTKAV